MTRPLVSGYTPSANDDYDGLKKSLCTDFKEMLGMRDSGELNSPTKDDDWPYSSTFPLNTEIDYDAFECILRVHLSELFMKWAGGHIRVDYSSAENDGRLIRVKYFATNDTEVITIEYGLSLGGDRIEINRHSHDNVPDLLATDIWTRVATRDGGFVLA